MAVHSPPFSIRSRGISCYRCFGRRHGCRFRGGGGLGAAAIFLRADVGRIIAKRRAKASTHTDLLDLLLKARDAETGRGMNDAELVANLLTFISAGHETTAVALTWTLWLLAKDEAVQRRVYDEVDALLGA